MRRRYFRLETINGDLDAKTVEVALELGAKIDEDRCELFINEDLDPLIFIGLLGHGLIPPLEHKSVLKREGNVIWLRKNAKDKTLDPGVTLAAHDIYLNCPKKEEAACKAEGGKWDPRKKQWFVPEGVAMGPFWQWIADS